MIIGENSNFCIAEIVQKNLEFEAFLQLFYLFFHI